MKKLILTAMAVVTIIGTASAELEWLAEEYDFGTFLESCGPQTGNVRFVNKGPEPTILSRVRPSCGCTAATYTEGEIAVGDTAVVNFTYNPVGRPGRFEKTVKVYTGTNNRLKTIRIRGTVIGSPETLRLDYPVEAGALRLTTNRLEGGVVKFGTARHFFVTGYNMSNDTIFPVYECDNPALSIDIPKDGVVPGDVFAISVYFNSRDVKQPGPISIPITVKASKDAKDEARVIFLADVVADVGRMSPMEVKQGARISVTPELIDLGILQANKKKTITKEIIVENEGENELKILRIYCAEEGVKAVKYPTHLKGGKRNTITVKIDPNKLKPGPQAIMLDIYTNDPVKPVKSIRIAVNKE